MHKIIGRLNHNILMMLCLGKGINHIHIFFVSLGLAVLFYFYFKNMDYIRNIESSKYIFVKVF